MHARHNVAASAHRAVHRLDIQVQQPVRVAAKRANPVADRRAAEHDERHLVELDIAAAKRGEIGNLLPENCAQIVEEGFVRGVAGPGDRVRQPPEVQRGGRRHRDLGLGAGRDRPEESKFLRRDRRGLLQRPDAIRRDEFLLMARRIVEGEQRRCNAEAVDGVDPVAPIGFPPEFAVGHHFQAQALLHGHDVADRHLLAGLEGLVVDLAGAVGLERVLEGPGAQQAADMFGAEGRVAAGSAGVGHGCALVSIKGEYSILLPESPVPAQEARGSVADPGNAQQVRGAGGAERHAGRNDDGLAGFGESVGLRHLDGVVDHLLDAVGVV